jgi:hypothetical protein
MATGYYSPFGGGRGGTQDMLSKLEADKAAASQYGEAAAGQRGEVYTPVPQQLNNPYGGGGFGSYGGGGVSGYPNAGAPAGNNIVTSTGAGGGNINLSRGSYEDQQMLAMRAKLNDDAFAKRMAAFSTMGGASAPQVGGGNIAANEEAARSVAFARAKDRAGKTALSSLTALQNVMANRGMSGSTEEARGMGAALQGGEDVINEFGREELMNDLNRAAQIGDRNYSGAITQRGQDMNAKQSLLGLISSAAGGLY